MQFLEYSFRHARVLLNQPEFIDQYQEISSVINNVTEEDIINKYNEATRRGADGGRKSISVSINKLLKERFEAANWNSESAIFHGDIYERPREKYWRLDFAKGDISIEVAFNHEGSIAWNLIKPVLASELNHVEKAIQTQIGVIITATREMKTIGGFDDAIGTFEQFQEHLPPLQNLLTIPILIIGLLPPTTFRMTQITNTTTGKKYGIIERI